MSFHVLPFHRKRLSWSASNTPSRSPSPSSTGLLSGFTSMRPARRGTRFLCAAIPIFLLSILASLAFTYTFVDSSLWLPILKKTPFTHSIYCTAVINTDQNPVVVDPKLDPVYQLEHTPNAPLAKQIPAYELIEQHLSNTLPSSLTSPKFLITPLIHQSWNSNDLPSKVKPMSETWRLTYPNYTYVLWKDYDNLLLVERLYPQYLQTYLSLPQEIYRADFVRPLYMHAFGGIYVDLDTDSIESLEHTFHSSAPATNFSTIAYLAQMGTDTSFEHSIPNAFMASTPNHPFWPYLVQLSQIYAEAQLSSFASKVWDPEWVTGPVVLKKAVETYPNPVNGGELVVLPPNTVYPFDWEHAGERTNCLCHGLEKTFNRAKCRALLRPLGPSAVAYWNRSWGEKNILKLLFSGKG